MRLIPSDTHDYAYTVNFFRVERGGTLRLRLFSGEVRTLKVASGGTVSLPVKRLYRTGTTAAGFQTDPFANNGEARNRPVPYAGPFDDPVPDLLSGLDALFELEFDGTDSTGGTALTTSNGSPAYGAAVVGNGLLTGGLQRDASGRTDQAFAATDGTVMGWVRAAPQGVGKGATSGFTLCNRTQGLGLVYSAAGTTPTIDYHVGNVPRFTVDNALALGEWSHVALTWVAATTTLTLYVNGVQVAQQVTGDPGPNGFGQFPVEVRASGETGPVDTPVDQVAVYVGRALRPVDLLYAFAKGAGRLILPLPTVPPGSQTITAAGSHTFTPAAGVTRVRVQLWGGGSGSADGTSTTASSGGGGGGYSESVITVTPGLACTVVVGAGGAANSVFGGGDSQFVRDDGYTVAAGGGGPALFSEAGGTFGGWGGNAYDAGNGFSNSGAGGYTNADIHYQGGFGADASGDVGGGGGSSAGPAADGNNAAGQLGGAAPAGGGKGGTGSQGGAINFPGPSAPGGGAGGGAGTDTSWNGADGKAIISWPA